MLKRLKKNIGYIVKNSLYTPPISCKGNKYLQELQVTNTDRLNFEVPDQISTPIFYANAPPHLGHLATLFLADAIKKVFLLQGAPSPMLTTGVDMHGIKVFLAAQNAGISSEEFSQMISDKFEELVKVGNIDVDKFARTTDKNHIHAVNTFWDTLHSKGLITQGYYEGFYDPIDEAFVSKINTYVTQTGERVLKSGLLNSIILRKVEEAKELNYMLNLEEYESDIKELVSKHDLEKEMPLIMPFHYAVGLFPFRNYFPKSLSISRPIKRNPFGIPVPGDPSSTIYVWFDALIYYLTCQGYPAQSPCNKILYVIGKDIMKFHAVIWQAMLKAANIPLPRQQIFVHGHLTIDGVKISKSLGNATFDPFELIKKKGLNAVRFFLVREGPQGTDVDFTEGLLIRKYNQLVMQYVNVVHRLSNSNFQTAELKAGGEFTHKSENMLELMKLVQNKLSKAKQLLSQFKFMATYHILAAVITEGNKFLTESKFWELEKGMQADVIFLVFEIWRNVSILLIPFVPEMANNILNYMGVSTDERNFEHVKLKVEGANKYPIHFIPQLKGKAFYARHETPRKQSIYSYLI